MLKAVARHSDQKWVVMYVERWLKAPMQRPDGTLVPRVKGTPQGSPISRCLANLFLHYGLDAWMVREFPTIQFERFADDAVIHCVSERKPASCGMAVARRLVEVGLELHPDKTRIVYCKDSRPPRNLRGGLVHVLRLHVPAPEGVQHSARDEVFTGFLPAVSPGKLTLMSRRVASWRIHRRTNLTLDDLAAGINLGAAGLARILHRVLPDRGDPTLPAHRSPSDALGEVEVQTTGTQPQTGTSVAAGRPNPDP